MIQFINTYIQSVFKIALGASREATEVMQKLESDIAF